ncbi:universal stress protein [Kineococcus sp. T13]|uniref:universal stress protein n=1 Tax=Kineococcus vitellinus TaxID=2696565 RepID=UPI001412F777|nr:universal stress protein [Kineococcus vitellinus]
MSVVVGYVPDRTGFLAVTEAIRQARWRGCAVVVVNVVDEAGYTRPTAADEVDLDAVQQRLDEAGVPHRVEHRTGAAGTSAETILEVAESEAAELVVVGLHRRSPVRKALLGSTAQRVLLDAPCPVLAVRAPATA